MRHGGGAHGSPQAATGLHGRVSLVRNGVKWRITNLEHVARALSKWA
jgi:hypothetical protein